MSEFRTPHAFENVAQAIQDAMDPEKPQTMGAAINLVNENARAVEDAINGIDVTGESGGQNFANLDESQLGSMTWTLPGTADTFLANVSASSFIPTGAVLHLIVGGKDTTATSTTISVETLASASMTLYSGPYDIDVFWYDPGNLDQHSISLEFSAFKVA